MEDLPALVVDQRQNSDRSVLKVNENTNSSPSLQELFQEMIKKSSEGDYIFRGESECYQKISSTLYRQYESEIRTEHFNIEYAQMEMLKDVKRFTAFADETDILTEMQHYGGNTNLIDFTTDYLIALFFACDSSLDENGRLIFLDKSSTTYRIEPPKKNQNNRVISQKSIFVRSPTGLIDYSQVETVLIPSNLKREALEYLKKHHGITTETIYSDIWGYIWNQERHHTAYAAFYIGFTYANEGEYEKAISYYDETICLNPNVTSAYRNRGAAKAKLGFHEEAIDDYTILLGFNPRDADAFYSRGISHSKRNQHEDAIADYSEAIRIDPKHFKAYSNRGIAKALLTQYVKAIPDFNEAIRLSPKDATLFHNRGMAKEGLNQFDDAIVDYDEAIRLNPEYAVAFFQRGYCKGALNRFEESIADIDEAIRLVPEFVLAIYHRGTAAKSIGRLVEAKDNLTHALALAEEKELEELVLLCQGELETLHLSGPESK